MHRYNTHTGEDPKHITPEDPKYCAFIRTKPCVVCARQSICHHEPLAGRGIALKGSDYETLPLCEKCHEARHRIGKLTFWGNHFGCVIDDFAGKGTIDFLIAKMIIGYLTEYLQGKMDINKILAEVFVLAKAEIETEVRKRFKYIIGGKSLIIPRIAVKIAIDDIFGKPDAG